MKITLRQWKNGTAPQGDYVINGTVPPYVRTRATKNGLPVRYPITDGLAKHINQKRKEMMQP